MDVASFQALEPASSPTAKSPLPRFLCLLVALALALGLFLRFRGLGYPPYDSHDFRQCQTLSTIEAFYANGIDFLHPRTLYTGYPGTFVMEVPLFQAIAASLYHLFGPHWEVVRCLNILFGAASTLLLFLITTRFLTRTTAILAALIYWLAPLNILYQRSTLIDPMAVFCALLSFYSLSLLLGSGDNTSDASCQRRWISFSAFAIAAFLTALIKPLYLWPSVLLVAHAFSTRRPKLDRCILQIAVVFALAGASFIAWNHYATRVNGASVITRGNSPTALLGFSTLLNPKFYYFMLISRPKVWLGPIPALLYLFGLWAWLAERRGRNQSSDIGLPTKCSERLLPILLAPPTYLVAFANINYPHDYYQLIISPFLAVVSAMGLRWLAARFALRIPNPAKLYPALALCAGNVLLVAAFLTYAMWFKMPSVNHRLTDFENLCAGKMQPWAPAMLFASPDASGLPTNSYIPGFLYAARLWGYSWVVQDAAAAKAPFEEISPSFSRLDYLVFYGTGRPDWLPSARFRLAIQDDPHGLLVFQRIASP